MKFKVHIDRSLPVLLYPIGDGIAQIILQEFNLNRLIALIFLALVFYQWEIPSFFRFLNDYKATPRISNIPGLSLFFDDSHQFNGWGKTLLANLYFNPVWIARHMIIIDLATQELTTVHWKSLLLVNLHLGVKSFLITLPLTLIGNFVIQNKLTIRWRFLGSAVFSGLLGTTYALAYRFF